MPTSWPPATAPSWPPPELGTTWLSTSDLRTLALILLEAGFTMQTPTSAERTAFFKNARCDHGDTVTGRMIVSPSGTRYPFAICSNGAHRDLLVLWPPYYAGMNSGVE